MLCQHLSKPLNKITVQVLTSAWATISSTSCPGFSVRTLLPLVRLSLPGNPAKVQAPTLVYYTLFKMKTQ